MKYNTTRKQNEREQIEASVVRLLFSRKVTNYCIIPPLRFCVSSFPPATERKALTYSTVEGYFEDFPGFVYIYIYISPNDHYCSSLTLKGNF